MICLCSCRTRARGPRGPGAVGADPQAVRARRGVPARAGQGRRAGPGLIASSRSSTACIASRCGSSRCRSSRRGSSPATTSASTCPRSRTTASRTRSDRWWRSRSLRGDQPDRADHAPRRRGAPHARRDAVRNGDDQPEHPRDPRRPDRGVGHPGHGRRAEGHPAPESMSAPWPARPRPSGRSAPRSSPPRASRSPPASWRTRPT